MKLMVFCLLSVLVLQAPAYASGAVVRLTLADAVRIAVEKNLDVRIEKYNPAQQEAEYRKNLGIYDPSLQLLTSYNDNAATSSFLSNPPNRLATTTTQLNAGISQLFFTGGTATLGLNNSYMRNEAASTPGLSSYWQSNLGITLNQPLLKKFGREATELLIDSARLGKDASLEKLNSKLVATIAQVRTEYYKLYSLREELTVKKVSLELSTKILVETKARVRAGVMPAMEILNAEFGVASREKDIIDAERAVSDQVDVLRQMIQGDFGVDIETSEVPSKVPYDVSEQQEIKRAIESRAELRELQRSLEIARLQSRVAGNMTRPDLALTASYASNGLSATYDRNINRLASNEYPNWGVGLTFTYPLGNRSAENDYRKSRLKVEQMALQLKNQEELVINEVRSAVRAVAANFKQLEVADRGRAFAEERFKAFAKKVEVGLSTNKELLDVENDLVNAKNNQIKALVAYANAITQLWKVNGQMLEKENIRFSDMNVDSLVNGLK